jgi:uncharacterized protein (TIGR02449 family)
MIDEKIAKDADMAELNLASLQEALDQVCDKVTTLSQENKQLQNELQGSENVRRLLVRKNKQLAEQVKQIIHELKATSL